MVHNFYQHAGGEDQVFAAESELLENQGHSVWRYTLHNDQIKTTQPIVAAGKTLWNHAVYQDVRSLIRQHQIQVAHFHNTFPLVSPAAYYAAKAEGAAVVQTFHNYRLLCANALFLRDGKVCESCLGKPAIAAVQNGCYRNSKVASAAVATMLSAHWAAKTWTRQVDRYIALTEFARQKFIQGGVPAEKLVVKPNFVAPDPGVGAGDGGYALFVGRLSEEKGVDLLLDAWKQLDGKLPLKIVGDGPLADRVAAAVGRVPGIEWLGRRATDEVYTLLKGAIALVFPSKWYEGLPRTIVEAFAAGTPVIAANLGSMSSLVTPHRTGLHFQPGSAEDLVAKVEWAIEHREILAQMRQQVRAEYETNYTPDQSYRQLIDIYAAARSLEPVKQPVSKVV